MPQIFAGVFLGYILEILSSCQPSNVVSGKELNVRVDIKLNSLKRNLSYKIVLRRYPISPWGLRKHVVCCPVSENDTT